MGYDGYFWNIFGPHFTQFGDFKANNATKEGCSLVWDSVPGPGATLDQLGTLLGVLGASNPQNTPQNAYFGGIVDQIFPDFGNLKPKVTAGRAVE